MHSSSSAPAKEAALADQPNAIVPESDPEWCSSDTLLLLALVLPHLRMISTAAYPWFDSFIAIGAVLGLLCLACLLNEAGWVWIFLCKLVADDADFGDELNSVDSADCTDKFDKGPTVVTLAVCLLMPGLFMAYLHMERNFGCMTA